MSEISDYQVVQDTEQLAELSDAHGTDGTNGAHPGSRANEGNGASAGDLTDFGAAASSPPDTSEPQPASSRLDTWGPNVPALRLANTKSLNIAESDTLIAATAESPATAACDSIASPPRLLRVIRFVVGVLLLVGAWGASVAVYLLARNLVDGFPSGMALTVEVVLYVLSTLGALWLALVALACLAAGAFALSLAFTARGW